MLIIDYHVHLWSPRFIPAAVRHRFAERAAMRHWPPRDPEAIFPRVSKGVDDPDGIYLMADLDRAGVDAAVSALVDYGVLVEEEPEVPLSDILAHYAALQQKYQNRFYAFATVDPRRPEARDLIYRAFTEWEMKGLKLYPPAGFFPYDPVCFPLYELCLEFDLPVIFHTSPPGVPGIPRFTHPIGVGDVQARFPDLKIVMAHTGYEIWWQEAMAVAEGHAHTYLDLSQWGNWALAHPESFLQRLAVMRDQVGAHKIIFASDHCPGPGAGSAASAWTAWVRMLKDLPRIASTYGLSFSETERDLILGRNAARLLKIAWSERDALHEGLSFP